MLLAVCTCAVQAQFQTVRADIVVYFPRGFIGPESSIFFNSLYRNKLEKNGADLGITVYGTSCVLYATIYYNPSTIVIITNNNNNNNKERKKENTARNSINVAHCQRDCSIREMHLQPLHFAFADYFVSNTTISISKLTEICRLLSYSYHLAS